MIINGECLEILKGLESESINCCVTSPPYYGLRDYGVDGQIGLEDTPQEYLDKLVNVFGEVKRVLRNDGTLWINIGDSYVGTGGNRKNAENNKIFNHLQQNNPKDGRYEKICRMMQEGLKPKDLIGIPWMLAFALREDGWYLRQDIIWHKTNPMPESVTDRCTKSHEYIFLLSKSAKYYFSHEEIKEPCVGREGNNKTFRGGGAYTNNRSFNNSSSGEKTSIGNMPNELGLRNKRDVWSIGTKGYKGAHFATYPEDLIKPCVLAGCPNGGTVIDPFFGSGTTGKVAKEYGRNFVGIELKFDYCKMAEKRIGN